MRGRVHGRSPGLCVHRGSLVRGEGAWPVTWVVCAQREPCEGGECMAGHLGCVCTEGAL